eukprot:GDKJ01003543.1.p1 GENE.GDKJ01003543.1~~GDKJ01003543.1.p1  ORF type:complete len:205 (+),score=10.68 GDKJ01003543.1:2-616(+)
MSNVSSIGAWRLVPCNEADSLPQATTANNLHNRPGFFLQPADAFTLPLRFSSSKANARDLASQPSATPPSLTALQDQAYKPFPMPAAYHPNHPLIHPSTTQSTKTDYNNNTVNINPQQLQQHHPNKVTIYTLEDKSQPLPPIYTQYPIAVDGGKLTRTRPEGPSSLPPPNRYSVKAGRLPPPTPPPARSLFGSEATWAHSSTFI